MANQAIRLKQRFSFIQRFRGSTIRVRKLAACARGFLFSWAKVERMETTRDGTGDGALEREPIPGY